MIVDKSVDGATNSFEGSTDADEEIALDLQVLASIVPSAKLVVYFAQNTTASLAAAIHAAVFDDVNRPNILSISWGSAEKFWTESARAAVQAALADAVRLKMTVTAASGDFLATGGLSDQKAHVFFPAASPYVLSCGGSAVTVAGGAITAEIAWKDGSTGTGGGISDTFPVPEYQRALTLPPSANDGGIRRGVPDVAAAAARFPGYRIFVGGNPVITDGTSAVAPLWAAIVAIANTRMGAPMGFINPSLYANSNLFRAIVRGDNRVNSIGYSAGPGWNACTGLGSPHAKDIIDALLQPTVS